MLVELRNMQTMITISFLETNFPKTGKWSYDLPFRFFNFLIYQNIVISLTICLNAVTFFGHTLRMIDSFLSSSVLHLMGYTAAAEQIYLR